MILNSAHFIGIYSFIKEINTKEQTNKMII